MAICLASRNLSAPQLRKNSFAKPLLEHLAIITHTADQQSTNAIALSILCIPDISHFHLHSSPCPLTESRNSSISTAGPLTHLQSPCSYRFIFTGQLPNLPASCTLAPHLYIWGLEKPWMLQTQTGKFCWKKNLLNWHPAIPTLVYTSWNHRSQKTSSSSSAAKKPPAKPAKPAPAIAIPFPPVC